MNFIFRESLNHRYSFRQTRNAVLPNQQFLPGHFFVPQHFHQQVQFTLPAFLANTAQESAPKRKGKEKAKPKAADWSEQESKYLLRARAVHVRYERLKGAFNKVRTAIWNEIF